GRARWGLRRRARALGGRRVPPAYTAARGVNPLRYRIFAFAISGFLAGVAGALYVSYNQSISPSVMGLTPMSVYVTMLVIGGRGASKGPLVGAGLAQLLSPAPAAHTLRRARHAGLVAGGGRRRGAGRPGRSRRPVLAEGRRVGGGRRASRTRSSRRRAI